MISFYKRLKDAFDGTAGGTIMAFGAASCALPEESTNSFENMSSSLGTELKSRRAALAAAVVS